MQHEPAIICQGCGFTNDTDSTSCYGCGLPLSDEIGLSAIEQGWPRGFWARLDASIIDILIQLPILIIIIFPLFGISMEEYFTPEEIFSPARLTSIALLITLNVLYGTLLVGTFATTTGKFMRQTDVLRSDGSRVGYGRALLRELAKVLSGIMLGIGFLMIAFRSDKRGLHDLIADTIVIRRWELLPNDVEGELSEEELRAIDERQYAIAEGRPIRSWMEEQLSTRFSEEELRALEEEEERAIDEEIRALDEKLEENLRVLSEKEVMTLYEQSSRQTKFLRIGLVALMLLVFAGVLMFIVQP